MFNPNKAGKGNQNNKTQKKQKVYYKMAGPDPNLSKITLNISGLNIPIKKTEQQQSLWKIWKEQTTQPLHPSPPCSQSNQEAKLRTRENYK